MGIASSVSVSPKSAVMGSTVTISISAFAPDYTHTLRYSYGSASGTIATKTSQTSVSWTIPTSLLTAAASGTCTITCITYDYDNVNSGSTTCTLTLTRPGAGTPSVKKSGSTVTSVTIGDSVVVMTGTPASQYTHTLTYTIGGATGVIASNVTTSTSWTVPDLTAYMANSDSATLTITSTAYYGGSAVGTKTCTVTLFLAANTECSISDISPCMGQTVTFTMTSSLASPLYDLTYSFAGATGTIATGSTGTASWTIPDMSDKIPNATSGSLTVTCRTRSGSAVVGTTVLPLTLSTPGATTPEPPTSAPLGAEITISLPRMAAHFTHTLTYSFGGTTGTIGTALATSATWTPPYSLAAQIKTHTGATCTLTCTTYHGDDEVGSEMAQFTLTVPDNDTTKPVATMVLSASGSLTGVFEGEYIQQVNGVTAAFTASSDYALIESYKLTVEGVETTGNPATSAAFAQSGEITITGRVTDSRGYVRTLTQTITVRPYGAPAVVPYEGYNRIVCQRCTSDGVASANGTYVLLKAKLRYSPVTIDGAQTNFAALRYRYKNASAGGYSEWLTLIAKTDTVEQVTEILSGIAISATTSYVLQISAIDDVGSETAIAVRIPAAGTPFHYGEGGLNAAVGMYCDYTDTNRFDVGWTTHFHTGVAPQTIFEGAGTATGALSGALAGDALTYTLFVVLVGGAPCLGVRHGDTLRASFAGEGITIDCEAESMTITANTFTSGSVTGIYALL